MPDRQLTESEIAALEARGCRAGDWTRITVADGFAPGRSFHRVSFSGDVRLGACAGDVGVARDFFLPAGVTHSRLHNVRLGDNCLVQDSTLTNVDVGDDVVIDRVGMLMGDGPGAFANGLMANVLAEDGARALPLWRGLSSQLAHVLCHLKGTPAAEALTAVVRREAEGLAGRRSRVGSGCRLRRSGLIKNVLLGPGVLLDGVRTLSSCHVEGGAAPARLGEGVAAEECVFLAACEVGGGAQLERCLVGEGARVDKAFSAAHSLFFANADLLMGEALAVMAGPFSVSHHKATLALSCQNSFSNFGSASNSSNHHFKLGPRHCGVLRRGARLGSGSYLFWPADIGAFTTIVGRHASEHLDTVIFPFSLLIAKNDASLLVPGVNLFGVGCFRDAGKWLERDRRGRVARPLDMVNAAVMSPYALQAMDAGAALLRRSQGMEGDLRYGGAVIPARRIGPALKLYEAATTLYIGELLLRRAREETRGGPVRAEDVAAVIASATPAEQEQAGGRWRDWGGMLLSGADADAFIADAGAGRLATEEAIRRRFEEVHSLYPARALAWACWRWRREHGYPAIMGEIARFFDKWRKAVLFRREGLVRDVAKEFTREMMHGFGVEMDAAEAFLRVRGEAADEPWLRRAEEETEELLRLAEGIG